MSEEKAGRRRSDARTPSGFGNPVPDCMRSQESMSERFPPGAKNRSHRAGDESVTHNKLNRHYGMASQVGVGYHAALTDLPRGTLWTTPGGIETRPAD